MNTLVLSSLLAVLLLTVSWAQTAERSWINSDVAMLKDNETFCKCKKLTSGKLQCKNAKGQTLVKWRKGICVCSKEGKRMKLGWCLKPRYPVAILS